MGDDGGNLNPFQKIFVFYKAPIVKYVGTCISYLIFLLLYSYVVLFGFRYEFQIPELIVYGERHALYFSYDCTANYYKVCSNDTIFFEIAFQFDSAAWIGILILDEMREVRTNIFHYEFALTIYF